MMKGAEFRARREGLGLTQALVAERLKVTATTIRNWESEPDSIPLQAQMLWEVWERRFRQESPNFGTVTLFYVSAPMFLRPDAPRSALKPPGQEWFMTNASAVARAGALWGRPGFENPMILQESGEILWTPNELERVFRGEDPNAPTIPVMLRAIASYVLTYSVRYVRNGPRLPSPAEVQDRRNQLEAEAGKLEALAENDDPRSVSRAQFEAVHDRLNLLGMYPPGQMVAGVHQAYFARAKEWPVE